MQKVARYILVLVIGTIIGLSIGIYVLINQTPNMEEQVKVTIQGIEYTMEDHSVLKIELLNDVPEKNLEGYVAVYQDENQWTSEVIWYYTGYGVAEVICEYINVTMNFRVTYIENYPKATYLDRRVGWNEVKSPSLTFEFMDTEPLSITKVNFNSGLDKMNVTLVNTGTSDVIISAATVTGQGVTGTTCTILGSPVTIVNDGVEHELNIKLGGTAIAGNLYTVELLSSKGNKYTYTITA